MHLLLHVGMYCTDRYIIVHKNIIYFNNVTAKNDIIDSFYTNFVAHSCSLRRISEMYIKFKLEI